MWFVQPLQIADSSGNPTGRYRMTAQSDEGGGGPYGDVSHDHTSAAEAQECEKCDEFISGITGLPSKKTLAKQKDEHERAEYQRLKEKFGDA